MNKSLWNLKAKFYRLVRLNFPCNLILKSENKKLDLLIQFLDTNGKIVVDLGTGTGNVLQFLNHSRLLLGIDIADQMIKSARVTNPGAELVQADALHLPIKTDSVELITAIGLSEYTKDIKSLFQEAGRILKNGGYFLMTYSPSGLWTGLRLLLGNAIYARNLNEIQKIAQNQQFRIMKTSHSLMQVQVLHQKNLFRPGK